MFIYVDEDFTLIERCQFINMQWRRRYYDYGEFELQITKSQYVPEAKYIFNNETGEVAEICKIELSSDVKGTYILMTGYFIETWLSRGITLKPGTIPNKNIVEACKNFVQNRVINDLSFGALLSIGTCKTTTRTEEATDEQITEIGGICRSLLMSIEYAQKLVFDVAQKKFYYTIWQGVDRTIEGRDYCVFSDTLGNINDLKYSDDDSDIKNFAYIDIDRGEDRHINTTFSVAQTGEALRKMYLAISDTESETDDIARATAKSQANLELLNHRRITNISFSPTINYISQYLVDYDLGDKILLNVNDLQKTFSYRIVGVNEVYKNNVLELELIFGDLKKLKYDKRRL